jgi:hypothetical protein
VWSSWWWSADGGQCSPALATSYFLRWWFNLATCISLVFVLPGWSLAGVKTLLGSSDADHGDAYGCRFLLGGMVMGLTLLLLHVGGNLRSGFAGPGNGGAAAAFSS